jgi:hypothetical protein
MWKIRPSRAICPFTAQPMAEISLGSPLSSSQLAILMSVANSTALHSNLPSVQTMVKPFRCCSRLGQTHFSRMTFSLVTSCAMLQ